MSTRENSNPNPTFGISPPVIIVIVIVAAVAAVILCASIYHFCRFKPHVYTSFEGDDAEVDHVFNPNKPPSEEQSARLKEVRWINNMYAWERGRLARIEIGELRPSTMILRADPGREELDRGWDEWNADGSERISSPKVRDESSNNNHATNPYARHSRRYSRNSDDPYSRVSRFLGLPGSASRNNLRDSLQVEDCRNDNRASSVLLPPTLPHDLSREELHTESPTRRYQPGAPVSDVSEEAEWFDPDGQVSGAQPHPEDKPATGRTRHGHQQKSISQRQPFYCEDYANPYAPPSAQTHAPVQYSQHQTGNPYRLPASPNDPRRYASHPKITLNDSSQDIGETVLPSLPSPRAVSPNPSFTSIINFEEIPLKEVTNIHNRDSLSGAVSLNLGGSTSTSTTRPHIDPLAGEQPAAPSAHATTFESMELRGATSQARDAEDAAAQDHDNSHHHHLNRQRRQQQRQGDEAEGYETDIADEALNRHRADSEGVKGMIAEWEHRHGRFGRR